MKRKKIAIIGSGISGLTCAYKLHAHHDISLFEAADYIGGHTHTVEVEKDGEHSAIDTGFIVFNERTYPRFIALMDELGVASQASEMSFSVRNDAIDLEYNGGDFAGLFAQKKNLVRPQFWKMLYDIIRFNKDIRGASAGDTGQTIGEYLARNTYSELFRENYLLPMISAIWSMGLDSCRDFPLSFFARFFDNHGLLDVINRPQWFVICGGSSSYIEPLTASYKEKIRLNCPVTRVKRLENGVQVAFHNGDEIFDEVIMACHGDQSLILLDSPTSEEKRILSEFQTTENRVVLHTDTSILPRQKAAWASWNYNMVDAGREMTTLTYNMNILQRLDKKRHTYLVTLNQQIKEQHILAECTYRHPRYTTAAIAAQSLWSTISGIDRVHFCGAYWFNGFHEDGVRSGLRVCKAMEGAS